MKKTEILSVNLFKITGQEIVNILDSQKYNRKHGWELIPKYIILGDKECLQPTDYRLQFISKNSGHNLNETYYCFDVRHMSELLDFEVKETLNYEQELYDIISSFDYKNCAKEFKYRYNMGNELHVLVDMTYEGEYIECILEFKDIL